MSRREWTHEEVLSALVELRDALAVSREQWQIERQLAIEEVDKRWEPELNSIMKQAQKAMELEKQLRPQGGTPPHERPQESENNPHPL